MKVRWLSLLTLLVVAGCLTAPTEEPEHHTPAHKPADFPAAVARLTELHREMLSDATRSSEQLDVFTEFTDVVRWLPELAADSDLAEEPWNRVHVAARELESLLEPVLTAHDRRAAYRKLDQRIASPFAELARIEPEFPRRRSVTTAEAPQ